MILLLITNPEFEMPRPHSVESKIPAAVKTAYQEYGFTKKLETALAYREGKEFAAILFRGDGEYFGVSLRRTDNPEGFEVWNDYRQFQSADEFHAETLY
jgi:hypothetical protein